MDAGLETPDARVIETAEERAAAALEKAYAIYGRPGEDPAAADDDPKADDAQPALPDELQALLDSLSTDLPRVESLAGDTKDLTNDLMKMAEKKLADGKYFDAEALYRQAARNNPDNPLASVGLIHAQMGAGLIRTSSLNLHRLFEKHPELINVRYEAEVLPPAERLQWLQGELQRMIDSKQYNGEPGLMLAYLGHQTGSRELIRYGLAIADARAPRDPLLAVLRGVWLHDEDAPKQIKKQPAEKPAADQPAAKQADPPAAKDAPVEAPGTADLEGALDAK